jgi:hypothetical protein
MMMMTPIMNWDVPGYTENGMKPGEVLAEF